jgi:hypothetical protein
MTQAAAVGAVMQALRVLLLVVLLACWVSAGEAECGEVCSDSGHRMFNL